MEQSRNRHFTKEIQITIKNMTNGIDVQHHQSSEMKIKNTMRNHSIPTRIINVKMTDNVKCCQI